MTLRGRALRWLHLLSVSLIVANVLIGYGVAHGDLPIARHIPWGFFSALLIAFAHTMTIFYFAGIGVSMREAAGGRRWCVPYLETAAKLRQRLALPLGLALISLMGAVILGGGSHTRVLPSWPHHTAALAALALNLFASWRSIAGVRANETLIRELQDQLTTRTGHGGVAVDRAAGGR